MKIFIVFLALLIVNISVLTYKSDYDRYTYLQRTLDNIAFESAEIAIWGGVEEANRHAEEFLNYTVLSLKNIKIKNSACFVYYEDEVAIAIISIDVENLFRFPRLPVTTITAERSLLKFNLQKSKIL